MHEVQALQLLDSQEHQARRTEIGVREVLQVVQSANEAQTIKENINPQRGFMGV